MYLPKSYTLHVETRENIAGIWLCLDDGFNSVPLAMFISEEAAEQYKRAISIATAKGHAMGKFGI